MNTALLVLHYFICIFLIISILLQAGKGADMGAAFGGASQTVFGGRGPATFLSKMTSIVAIFFLITSVTLAQMSKKTSVKSVLDKAPAGQTVPAPTPPPVTPAPAPAEPQKK